MENSNSSRKVVGDRLKTERSRLGYESALAFSEVIDVPRATYLRYEAGTGSPRAEDLASMVAAGLDSHYLLTGQRLGGLDASGEYPADGTTVRIQVMEAEPSAGNGSTVEEYAMVRGFLDVQQDWAREFLGSRVCDMRLMFARGNSMAPTIWGGDPVFVDTGIRHFDGEGIYVFDFMGRLLIKRLRVDMVRQMVLICSDNDSEYPMQEVGQADLLQLHICGRVHTWLNVRRA